MARSPVASMPVTPRARDGSWYGGSFGCPRGMPGTATAAGVQYARPSRLRDRHGWRSRPQFSRGSGHGPRNISAPTSATTRPMATPTALIRASHASRSNASGPGTRTRPASMRATPAGHARPSAPAAIGARAGANPLAGLAAQRSNPTRRAERFSPTISGCGPFGPDPRCARLRQRERHALPHGLVGEVQKQRRHRDAARIDRPQVGALLRRWSGAARRPASSRDCPRCRGARRSAAGPGRAGPGVVTTVPTTSSGSRSGKLMFMTLEGAHSIASSLRISPGPCASAVCHLMPLRRRSRRPATAPSSGCRGWCPRRRRRWCRSR